MEERSECGGGANEIEEWRRKTSHWRERRSKLDVGGIEGADRRWLRIVNARPGEQAGASGELMGFRRVIGGASGGEVNLNLGEQAGANGEFRRVRDEGQQG